MSREELAARFSRPSPPRRRGEFRMLRAQVVVGRSRVRKVVERTRNRHSATQARANRYTGGEEAGCAGRAQQDNETAWGWGGRKELPPEREQRRRASACRAGSGAWVRARGSFADNRRSPGPAAPGPRPPRHSPSASRPMPLSVFIVSYVRPWHVPLFSRCPFRDIRAALLNKAAEHSRTRLQTKGTKHRRRPTRSSTD